MLVDANDRAVLAGRFCDDVHRSQLVERLGHMVARHAAGAANLRGAHVVGLLAVAVGFAHDGQHHALLLQGEAEAQDRIEQLVGNAHIPVFQSRAFAAAGATLIHVDNLELCAHASPLSRSMRATCPGLRDFSRATKAL
jgi:hypothetical protein